MTISTNIPVMSSQFSVTDLIRYLPHRKPMVWIDHVLEVGKDYRGITGTCLVHLDQTALYMSKGQVSGSAAIEFTGQAFGYLKAAYQEIHNINNPPKKTFLTGVRRCEADFSNLVVSSDPENPTNLLIKIQVLREISNLIFVKGEICTEHSDQVLGNTEIQVYVN